MHTIGCLDLSDDQSPDHQVKTVSLDLDALVGHDDRLLALERNVAQCQFMAQSIFVDAFQKASTERGVHLERSIEKSSPHGLCFTWDWRMIRHAFLSALGRHLFDSFVSVVAHMDLAELGAIRSLGSIVVVSDGFDKPPGLGYVAQVTIPNQITVARILATPLFMVFLYADGTLYKILAIAVFALAAISDAVDGYLARTLRQETAFGAFADPIADKLLVAAAFVSLVELGELRAWPVVTILAREFLVTGLRVLATAEGVTIRSSVLGKLKTFSHIGLVLFILSTRYFGLGPWGYQLKDAFLYLAVALALVSGAEYFWRGRRVFRAASLRP